MNTSCVIYLSAVDITLRLSVVISCFSWWLRKLLELLCCVVETRCLAWCMQACKKEKPGDSQNLLLRISGVVRSSALCPCEPFLQTSARGDQESSKRCLYDSLQSGCITTHSTSTLLKAISNDGATCSVKSSHSFSPSWRVLPCSCSN